MFVIFSIVGDFSTVARNDIVYDRFYNVISTGARVLPERSGEIPHGRGIISEETTNIFPAEEKYGPCKQQKNPPRKRYNVLINNKKNFPAEEI